MQSTPSTIRIVTSVDGTSIFAEATGDYQNPHVILTAGLTLSVSVYDEFVQNKQPLDSLYIVRYDIRGHGHSGKPTDAASYESERFAEDFKALVDVFKLNRPVFSGWSMGSTVVCDIAAHLPPASISAAIFLSGIPATGELIGELANPGLVEVLSGLLNIIDVNRWRSSGAIFTEKLFANSDTVPWSVKTMYLGNSLSSEIMTHQSQAYHGRAKVMGYGQGWVAVDRRSRSGGWSPVWGSQDCGECGQTTFCQL